MAARKSRFPTSWYTLLLLTNIIVSGAMAADDAKRQPIPCNVDDEIAAADHPFRCEPLKELWKTSNPVRPGSGLAFSRDGSRIVACLPSDGYIVLDGPTGKILHRHEQSLGSPILCVALSPDGKHAAFGLGNRTVIVVSLERDQIVHTHPATKTPLIGVHIAEDNQRVGWFEEGLTLHSALLKGGEAIKATHPDESKTPPNSESGELDSAENLVRPKNIYSVHFRGDGLTAMITPLESSTAYGEIYLPDEGRPSHHRKQPMFMGGLRAYELCPDHVGLLNAGGEVVLWSRLDGGFSFCSAIKLAGLMDGTPAMGMSNKDGNWLFLVGKGQVEVRALNIPHLPLIYDYSVDTPKQIVLAADGKRFAVVDSKGVLYVYTLPTPTTTPGWHFSRLVRKVARNKQYETLDEFHEKLSRRNKAFPWHGHPHDYNLLYYLIDTHSPWDQAPVNVEAYAKAWLRERPQSELARLLQAERIMDRGWDARGTGLADTVTPEGWKKFAAAHREAFQLISPILEKDLPSPLAFYDVFAIAKAESWSQSKLRPYLMRLEKLYPEDVFTHQLVVENLSPMWGGRPRDGEIYARQTADKRGPGAGDAFYAQMARTVASNHDYEEVFSDLGFDYERVQRGWRYLQQHDNRPNRGLMGELSFAFIKGDEPRLKVLCKKVLQEKVPYEHDIFEDRAEYQQIIAEYLKPELKEQRLKLEALSRN